MSGTRNSVIGGLLVLALVAFVVSGVFALRRPEPDPKKETLASLPEGKMPLGTPKGFDPSQYQQVSILMSQGVLGELRPCGCTRPPMGGFPRRSTVMQALRLEMGGAILAVDGGDLLYPAPKSRIDGLDEMYSARASLALAFAGELFDVMAPGEQDFSEFDRILQQGSTRKLLLTNLRHPNPVIVKSVVVKAGDVPFFFLNLMDRPSFERWGLQNAGLAFEDPKASVESLTSEIPKDAVVIASLHAEQADTLLGILGRLNRRTVVLSRHIAAGWQEKYHDLQDGALIVHPPAKGTHLIQVQLLLKKGTDRFYDLNKIDLYDQWIHEAEAKTREAESSGPADRLKRLQSMVTSYTEYRTKEVGLASTQSLLRVRPIPLGESIEAAPAITKRIQEAESEVHNRLASKIKGDPAQAGRYMGAQKCAACHPKNFERWSATKHAHALESLKAEDARNHECLSCHVTGFREYMNREDGEFLSRMKGVQCETCHGASGGHPPTASVRTPVAAVCIRCHNIERDPKFSFATYLEKATCSGKNN